MSRPAVRGAFFAATALAAALAAAAPAAAQVSPTPAAPPTAAAAPASKPAAADPTVPTASQAEGRVLNGHAFMEAGISRGPLTTTSFETEMVLVGGSATASTTIANKPISGTLSYAGLGAFFRYEYAFLDGLSARVAVNDLVYTGTNEAAILVIGAQLQAGFGAGATASMKLGDKVRLGVLADVTYAPNFAITVGKALSETIASCTPGPCEAASAASLVKVLTVQPALALAWAPWAPLGITANVSYLYLDPDGSLPSSQGMQLSTAVDFDFEPAVRVPVGLEAQFAWTAPFGSNSLQHVTDFGGGLFYTGRRDVSVGLQVVGRRYSIQPPVTAVGWSATVVTIGLRYYW